MDKAEAIGVTPVCDRRVLPGTVGRRRRYSPAEKRAILKAVAEAGETVSEVSRQYGIGRSLIHNWRRQQAVAMLGATVRFDEAFNRLVEECNRGHAGRAAEADFALHKTIIELADHGRLAWQYALIEQQTKMCIRSSDAHDPAALELKLDQHRPIVEAIRAGEIEAAGDLSEQHNLIEGEKLSTHLKWRESQEPIKDRTPVIRTARKRIAAA